jgi:hypothetical protein
MSRLWVCVREREREVKCCHRVKHLLFSTERKTLGDIAHQGGLNADRLCHQFSLYSVGVMGQHILPWLHPEARRPRQTVSP